MDGKINLLKMSKNNKPSLSHEERIKYLRIALGLQLIGINDRMADQILLTLDEIEKLGGEFSITDAVEIELRIERKYKRQELEEKSN